MRFDNTAPRVLFKITRSSTTRGNKGAVVGKAKDKEKLVSPDNQTE